MPQESWLNRISQVAQIVGLVPSVICCWIALRPPDGPQVPIAGSHPIPSTAIGLGVEMTRPLLISFGAALACFLIAGILGAISLIRAWWTRRHSPASNEMDYAPPLELGRHSDWVLSPLQIDAIRLSDELLTFLERIGGPPAPKYTRDQLDRMSAAETKRLIESEDGDFTEATAFHYGDERLFIRTEEGVYKNMMARCTRLYPWYEKLRASYALDFKARVETMRNRFALEGLSEEALLAPVEGSKGQDQVLLIAAKLWELAYRLKEKGIPHEKP